MYLLAYLLTYIHTQIPTNNFAVSHLEQADLGGDENSMPTQHPKPEVM